MNMILKHLEGTMQKHQHSIHNLFHNEAFWAAAIISFLLISMILLTVFAPNTGAPTNFPVPFGHFPYY